MAKEPKAAPKAKAADADAEDKTNGAPANGGTENGENADAGGPADPNVKPIGALVSPGAPLDPAAAFPGEETVLLNSPRAFNVLLQNGSRVGIKKGAQKVAKSIAEHPYVVQNGCTVV